MGGNALRSAELVLPGRVVVSSASECRWNVSSSGVRFGRCGYRVGGLEIKSCRLAGGWANNGEPTSRSPVPGRGHLFQQGSPPSPPWCVRPGAFFSPSRPPPALPLSRFSPLRRRTRKRRPRLRPPVAMKLCRGPNSTASFGKTWSRWGSLYAAR
jgi:hypothetical protein